MITIQSLPLEIDEHVYTRFAAFDGAKYIGTCDVRHRGRIASFRQLFVLTEYRRKRVGTLLMMAVEKAAFDSGCVVVKCRCRKDNYRAQAFYLGLGYEIEDDDGYDWIMARRIAPERKAA